MSVVINSALLFRGQINIGFTPTSSNFSLVSYVTASAQTTTSTTQLGTSSLTSLPANTLLIAILNSPFDSATTTSGNSSITSNPALTWTSKAINSGAAGAAWSRIYAAVFTNGGDIGITGSWSGGATLNNGIHTIVYAFEGANTGSIPTPTTLQTTETINITTTNPNSYVIVNGNDWNAINGSTRTYTNTPVTETGYYRSSGNNTVYNFYKTTGSIQTMTLGLNSPTGQSATTVAIEIVPA